MYVRDTPSKQSCLHQRNEVLPAKIAKIEVNAGRVRALFSRDVKMPVYTST